MAKPKTNKRKKPVKLSFFKPNNFPKRSKAEWKLIDKNPFGDTDGDKVPNWFDCKPLNKKKQGWTKPQYDDSVIVEVPIKRLYNLRGRYSMSNKKHSLKSLYDEERKIRDVARSRGENLDYEESRILARKQELDKIAKELAKKKKYVIKGTKLTRGKYDVDGEVKFTRPSKVYKKEIKGVMKPYHTQEMFSGDHKAKTEKEYVDNLAKAIKSKKKEVPMLSALAYHLDKGSTNFGEGRHRIIAAKKAGLKTIPVEIVQDTTYSPEEKITILKVQEARDKVKSKRKKLAKAPTKMAEEEDRVAAQIREV